MVDSPEVHHVAYEIVTSPHLLGEIAAESDYNARARCYKIALENGVSGADLFALLKNAIDAWRRGAAIRAGLELNLA